MTHVVSPKAIVEVYDPIRVGERSSREKSSPSWMIFTPFFDDTNTCCAWVGEEVREGSGVAEDRIQPFREEGGQHRRYANGIFEFAPAAAAVAAAAAVLPL